MGEAENDRIRALPDGAWVELGAATRDHDRMRLTHTDRLPSLSSGDPVELVCGNTIFLGDVISITSNTIEVRIAHTVDALRSAELIRIWTRTGAAA